MTSSQPVWIPAKWLQLTFYQTTKWMWLFLTVTEQAQLRRLYLEALRNPTQRNVYLSSITILGKSPWKGYHTISSWRRQGLTVFDCFHWSWNWILLILQGGRDRQSFWQVVVTDRRCSHRPTLLTTQAITFSSEIANLLLTTHHISIPRQVNLFDTNQNSLCFLSKSLWQCVEQFVHQDISQAQFRFDHEEEQLFATPASSVSQQFLHYTSSW